jgi:hypothetical protein
MVMLVTKREMRLSADSRVRGFGTSSEKRKSSTSRWSSGGCSLSAAGERGKCFDCFFFKRWMCSHETKKTKEPRRQR